jgi:hypothetical protein
MNSEQTDQMLTYEAAGRIAGVSRSMIGKWVKLGLLQRERKPGTSEVGIRKSKLIEFLTEGLREG